MKNAAKKVETLKLFFPRINRAGIFVAKLILAIVRTGRKSIPLQSGIFRKQHRHKERSRALPLKVKIMMAVDQPPALFDSFIEVNDFLYAC
jgi:hypothetical protein